MSRCARREVAVHGIRPCDVDGDVVVERRRVHQQQFAILHLPGRLLVVERGGVRTAPHDRGIAPVEGPVLFVDVLDGGFDLVFEGSGVRRLHAGHVRVARDVGALLQHLSFIRCLHLAGAREKIGRVANRQAKKPFPHFVGEQVLGGELAVQPWRRTEHEKTRLVLRERGLETGELGRAGGDTVGAA